MRVNVSLFLFAVFESIENTKAMKNVLFFLLENIEIFNIPI